MFGKKIDFTIIAVFILSTVVALFAIYYRYNLDVNHRTVEIAYNYDDIETMYLQTGIYRNEILKKLKIAGVTSIILEEDSISDLMNKGKITIIKGSDILNSNRILQRSYNQVFSRLPRNYSIQPEYFYIVIDENNLFEYVKRNLQIKLNENRVRDLGWNILEVISQKEDLFDVPLDINLNKAALINEFDFVVIPNFNNNDMFTEEQIGYKFSRLKEINYKLALFKTVDILGYPDYIDVTVIKANEFDKLIGFTEVLPQKGFSQLASDIPERAIKVHKMEMRENNEQYYISRALRAVLERNCRVLYIVPFINPADDSAYQFNLDFLKTLKGTLEKMGYVVTPIEKSPYADFYYPSTLLFVYIPVFLIFMVFTKLFFNNFKIKGVIFGAIIYSAVVGFANLGGFGRLINEVLALAIAVFSPVILYIFISQFLDNYKGKIKFIPYIGSFLIVFGGGLVTAIYLHNLLFDSNYFWAVFRFRGVKIASLLPIILLTIYFYIKPERIKYSYYVIKRYLSKHLTIKFLLILLFFFSFFIVYILRTGNYGMLILGKFEIVFREFLQHTFIVRPRTKEILIGYPLLVLTVFFWPKESVFKPFKQVMLVLSAISTISMINTFCHLHSPILVSFYRSVLGAIIGGVLGFLLILLYLLGARLYFWFQTFTNE